MTGESDVVKTLFVSDSAEAVEEQHRVRVVGVGAG
jgi:hypothetical protein